MPASVYSCINCGGGVRFDIASKAFKCEHCGTVFTLEEMNKAFPEVEQTDYLKSSEQESQDKGFISDYVLNAEVSEAEVKAYNCPACGAELMSDSDTLAAAHCAFCGNPVTISERLLSGESMPSRVIPFKKTREEAYIVFTDKYKNKPLLPKEFKAGVRPDEFKSVYIPFKLYDAGCSGSVTAACYNIESWTSGDYEYTKTDTYEARRAGTMTFIKVPYDVSDKIDDESMQAIEPFNMSEMTPFSKKYLSGHLAEAPTTAEGSLRESLYKRLRPAVENTLKRTIRGYDSVSISSSNVSVDKAVSEYVMFPVWMFVSKYKGLDYIYAINGQTGKFAGKFPVDWKYAGILFLKMALIIFFVVFLSLEVYLWLY